MDVLGRSSQVYAVFLHCQNTKQLSDTCWVCPDEGCQNKGRHRRAAVRALFRFAADIPCRNEGQEKSNSTFKTVKKVWVFFQVRHDVHELQEMSAFISEDKKLPEPFSLTGKP